VVPGVNYSVNEAPTISAPHWNLTGSLTHDWQASGGGTVSGEARVHYTTKQLLYPIAAPDAFAPAATIADLNLTYHSSNDAWFVGAYVKNAGNKTTVLSVFPGTLPAGCLFPRIQATRAPIRFHWTAANLWCAHRCEALNVKR